MTVTGLNGKYKLKYYDYGVFQIEELMQETFYPDDWIDTDVPEDVRTALKRYGYLDGYYYGKNLDKERWIEEKDWVYYHSFFVSPELEGQETELCFEGIDTIAKVWLNGVLLGFCKNMFLEHSFVVSDLLRYGEENKLVVQIISPVNYTKQMSRKGIFPENDTTRMLLRKSQMNWGWDFCGHCLTTGIWKSVVLKSYAGPSISEIQLLTVSLTEKAAQLVLHCNLRKTVQPYPQTDIEIKISAEGKVIYIKEMSCEQAENFIFNIENPGLWWPRPYGEPFLYDVLISLKDKNNIWEEKSFRYGIRKVELIQEKDDGGRSFVFSINGKKLFVRGANWVPLNSVYAEIRPEEYHYYMKRIIDSNLSMLRVWGGGIYESEDFLDLCDENGIMIFQDIMLACGIFPQTDAFMQEVYEETVAVVRKNINRTCIVLWAGGNELDEAYQWYDRAEQFSFNKINRVAIKKAVIENDQTRPFIVSSSCSPFENEEGGENPNSDKQGDMHLYLTRFVKEDPYYYKKIIELKPRFMSEYGFSSLPWEVSYYRFNYHRQPLDLMCNPWLGTLEWVHKIGETGDVPRTIYISQFTHAQGLKYWIEYLRSLKWHCGGSLYWKFNDPIAPNREDMLFPSLMSCIDFFHLPKLAYYYARRAYEDVILAFREDTAGNLEIYGCSEIENDLPGNLLVQIKKYNGKIIWQEQKESIIYSDNSSRMSTVLKEYLPENLLNSCYIYAEFTYGENRIRNIFHFTEIGEWNKVQMPKAKLDANIKALTNDWLEITLNADSFVQDIIIEVMDKEIYYSDNGFCMEGGECRVIQARVDKSCSNLGKLRIRSFNTDELCRNFTL